MNRTENTYSPEKDRAMAQSMYENLTMFTENEAMRQRRELLKSLLQATVAYVPTCMVHTSMSEFVLDFLIYDMTQELLADLTWAEFAEAFPPEDEQYFVKYPEKLDRRLGRGAVEHGLSGYPHPEVKLFVASDSIIMLNTAKVWVELSIIPVETKEREM